MASNRISLLVPALILAAVLPGAGALLYYKITGDPTMQPLAITFAKLAENDSSGQTAGIVIDIEWGVFAKTSNTRQEVKLALQKAMVVHGIDFLVRMRETDDDRISIFFVTGSTRTGPFRLSNAAAGVSSAVAAFHLSEVLAE